MPNEWDAYPIVGQPQQQTGSEWNAFPIATPQKPNVLADVAKSAGVGLGEGAIGTAGTIGDIRSALSSGASYVGGKLGLSPGAIQTGKDIFQNIVPSGNLIAAAPTSADIRGAVESATGPFYQPQTGLGEAAQTLGQFAPGVVGGPGGIGRRAVTQVVLPAIASTVAGKATEGTPYEPVARGAAAFLAGAGSGALANRATKAILPTGEQIRTAGSAGYEHPIVKDLELPPTKLSNLADDIAQNLKSDGYRRHSDATGGAAFPLVEELKSPAGTNANIDDIRGVQKALGKVASERDITGNPTPNAAAAISANQQIRSFLDNLSPTDVVKGDITKALPILKAANQDWASQAQSLGITSRLTKAERQAAKNQGSIQQAIKNKIAPVLDNPNLSVGLRPDEIAQAQRTVVGTRLENILRGASKLSYVPFLGHVGTAAASAGLSIPFQIAGALAKAGSTGITQRNARLLDEMIRRRSALAQQPQFQTGAASVPSPVLPGVNIANPYFASPPSPWNPIYSGLLAASAANR